MDRRLRAQLTLNEEAALRKIAAGSDGRGTPPADLLYLSGVWLIQSRDGKWELTAQPLKPPRHRATIVAMPQKWKPGDRVTVVTVNRGRPLLRAPKGHKSGTAETWPGEIVGPSLLGPGWWNVRRIGAKGRPRSAFAVPDNEIKLRKR